MQKVIPQNVWLVTYLLSSLLVCFAEVIHFALQAPVNVDCLSPSSMATWCWACWRSKTIWGWRQNQAVGSAHLSLKSVGGSGNICRFKDWQQSARLIHSVVNTHQTLFVTAHTRSFKTTLMNFVGFRSGDWYSSVFTCLFYQIQKPSWCKPDCCYIRPILILKISLKATEFSSSLSLFSFGTLTCTIVK